MKSRGEALRDYVIRRLLLMVPTFLGITFFTFLLCQFVPGGQIDQLRMAMAGAGGGGEAGGGGGGGDARVQLDIPEEQLDKLREYYGFDRPLLVAYGAWLFETVQLDLGDSFRYNEPVIRVIADRLPVSIYYGIVTALFTYGICIPPRYSQGHQAPHPCGQRDLDSHLRRLCRPRIRAGSGHE